MYRGATALNLDSKGRLAMPVRYREKILESSQGEMVCTVDIHQPCILLYPLPEWETIEKRLARLSSLDPGERRIQRLLLGYADEVQMDGVGRLLIAATLRQHAELQKQVILVGQFNKFELWGERQWYQQIQEDISAEKQASLALSERLQDFSL